MVSNGQIRVRDLRAMPYSGPLKRPFVTSRRRVDSIQGVLVEMDLDDGSHGFGTAAETWAVTGESVASVLAAINGPLFEALIGKDVSLREAEDAVANSCEGNMSAKAAVDVALHDAWASSLGLPLVAALGGRSDAHAVTDMTISLGSPETMAREAVAASEEGFEILKIKLGSDPRTDLDRLEAVHEAVPAARFRLDANQGWETKEAIRMIRRLEDTGIPVDLVEQPTPKGNLEALAKVTAAVETPIMADESVATERDALNVLRREAADLINIKLAKCGGIRSAMSIADLAAVSGVGCMMGAMMEPRVSIAAAAHAALAHPNIQLIDLDSAEWIQDPRIARGYEREGSKISLAETPGLGMDLDPSLTEGTAS
ncbi:MULTISPECIES: dipeptide epimerase [Micrococcaceae]|uniref:dipeptide epimerase n=1 Tax=unclassified Kocuria TaxID=2649579 RepID=UPI0010126D2B|nr:MULTISPECIES: dipeptide epimerase [unclassified Kocuria]